MRGKIIQSVTLFNARGWINVMKILEVIQSKCNRLVDCSGKTLSNYSLFILIMDKYNRVKMIGKGNFGDVWLVEDNKGQVLDEKATIHRNLP